MNCQDVEKILIEGEKVTDDVREHLASCSSCRSLARLMDGVMQPAPSAALDKAVLTQVKAEMRMRNHRRPAWIHIAYAAAAAVVLMLSLWIGHQKFWNDAPNGDDIIAQAEVTNTELDPLVGMFMAADQDLDDVEFMMDYSDIASDSGIADVGETVEDKGFSSQEFSDLADGMFSLELLMYQPALN
ncbi:MAG: hypothetical protein IKS92_06240 [Victivallales bacterium]|nr:hypothetical protein [Victivallales bacterium]